MDLTGVTNKITDILKSVQEKLKTNFPDMTVDLYSKQPSEYYLKSPNGAIMVHFGGSKYSKNFASDIIVQSRILQIELIVSMKNLKSDDSNVQDILDAVRIVLTGYRPCGSKKMYPVSETYIAEASGVWLYGIVFEVENINVEAVEDNEPENITSVTMSNEYYGDKEVYTQ